MRGGARGHADLGPWKACWVACWGSCGGSCRHCCRVSPPRGGAAFWCFERCGDRGRGTPRGGAGRAEDPGDPVQLGALARDKGRIQIRRRPRPQQRSRLSSPGGCTAGGVGAFLARDCGLELLHQRRGCCASGLSDNPELLAPLLDLLGLQVVAQLLRDFVFRQLPVQKGRHEQVVQVEVRVGRVLRSSRVGITTSSTISSTTSSTTSGRDSGAAARVFASSSSPLVARVSGRSWTTPPPIVRRQQRP